MAENETPVRNGWTDEMIATLDREYHAAREHGTLRELAEKIGVDLYDLYNKAHRRGLSKQIRRR